jgi:hypothetical protein
MLPALQEAVDHPDMTEELAEALSMGVVDVEYAVSTGVNVRDSDPWNQVAARAPFARAKLAFRSHDGAARSYRQFQTNASARLKCR